MKSTKHYIHSTLSGSIIGLKGTFLFEKDTDNVVNKKMHISIVDPCSKLYNMYKHMKAEKYKNDFNISNNYLECCKKIVEIEKDIKTVIGDVKFNILMNSLLHELSKSM